MPRPHLEPRVVRQEQLGTGVVKRAARWEESGRLFKSLVVDDYTLWLFDIAMDNDPFMDVSPMKSSIYSGFSMAILNNQMVEDL